VNAAGIVRGSTRGEDQLPADAEAAWEALSAHIQNVDQRGMTMLRAAFDAGYGQGKSPRDLEALTP
jgi:hypothetical protein